MVDLDKYVDLWVERANDGVSVEQKNLFTRKDYYELLKDVCDVITKNKDLSLEEIRQKIYENSGVENKIKDFILRKEMAPGMVVTYGTSNYNETIVIGNKKEVELDSNGSIVSSLSKMDADTIFDLASVTKLFTSLSILKLISSGEISLSDEVVKFCPYFKNLSGVTIYDLLSFNVPLVTSSRVDRASSKDEAEQILFDIKIDENSDKYKNPYTDMGAMILKYVIEEVTGKNYYDFLNENILSPLNMNDTHVLVPKYKLDRVASTGFDGKYYKDGNFSIDMSSKPGLVYDPKARTMGQFDGNLSGHAGLFSSAMDMKRLAKGIISSDVLPEDLLYELGKNRTGFKYNVDGQDKYVQYLGYLCYSKNPSLGNSELFHAMSGKSFASAGWTGNQFTVDPVNELYLFMAGNRSHNRLTFADSSKKDQIIESTDGKKSLILPDGTEMIDSTRFAWDRDLAVVQPILKLSIQYKMLEDILGLSKENVENNEKVRLL